MSQTILVIHIYFFTRLQNATEVNATSLTGLQSEFATEFVSVYLDDVIVFSEILIDHII